MNQPVQLSDFPAQTWDKVRYADTDRQGHVNNALFSTYVETGRVEFLYGGDLRPEMFGNSFVIASLQIDFLAEITWPGKVEIGTGVTRLGRSSFNLYQGLFQEGQLVATARTVIVQVSNETKKSAALNEEYRQLLEGLTVEG